MFICEFENTQFLYNVYFCVFNSNKLRTKKSCVVSDYYRLGLHIGRVKHGALKIR